jgi:hypothetical protein
VPVEQRINNTFYVEIIGKLLKHISRVRSQFRAEGILFLLHDIASAHSALVVKIFLTKHGVMEISYPSCSPDLEPADFFLFPRVKTALKGKRFQDVEDIMKSLKAELNAVPLEASADCFSKIFKLFILFPYFLFIFFIPVREPINRQYSEYVTV